MSLATKLVSLRKQKGLTQMELAGRLNVSRQAISRWEVGSAVPSLDNLKILGELYGVSVDYLLNDNAECDSKCSEPSEVNLKNQDDAQRRKKYKILGACILAFLLTVTALIFVSVVQNREQNTIIPLEDMSVGNEDDCSQGTFMIE